MKQTANTHPWRGVKYCIAASLFLAILSTPLLQVWVGQLQDMLPGGGEPIGQHVFNELHAAFTAEKKIYAVHAIFYELHNKTTPSFERARQADPDNGLYAYLELLQRLRQTDPKPTTQAHALDETLLQPLRQLKLEPPASLYEKRERQMMEQFFRNRSFSQRNSALFGLQAGQRYTDYRPVLRELADRLISLGTGWRVGGHPKEAVLAHAAVLHLFSDLINDSPTPEVVLLAAERLPALMNELSQDDPSMASDAQTAGKDITRLVQQWHQQTGSVSVSLIPYTSDFALAPAAHDAMICALVAEGLVITVWLMLLLVILGLALMLFTSGQLKWQLHNRGSWLASSIMISPLIVALIVVACAPLSFTWLFSPKSILPALLIPFTVLLCLGPSNRLAVTIGSADARVPTRAAGLMALVMAITLLVFFGLPVHHESWQPPILVQRFRMLGQPLLYVYAILFLGWFVWGQIRRRKAGWPMGFLARANLQVAARALLLTSILSIATLTVDRICEGRHQEAFARAAADPLADRLGSNWRQEYLAGIQALLQHVESN